LEGHDDPRYRSVFFNLGAIDLPCPHPLILIVLLLDHTRGTAVPVRVAADSGVAVPCEDA